VVLAIVLTFRVVARRMEARADAAAAGRESESRWAYGRALERIYEANLVPAVLRRKGTHPHLYDRLTACGPHPAYPRPQPPPSRSSRATAIVPVSALVMLVAAAACIPGSRDAEAERDLFVRMALAGGDAEQVGELALLRREAGAAGATALYRAQIRIAELEERDIDDRYWTLPRANLASALAGEGSCEEARAVLAEAERGPPPQRRRGIAVLEGATRAVQACQPRARRAASERPAR
jgi:hypothetical protein